MSKSPDMPFSKNNLNFHLLSFKNFFSVRKYEEIRLVCQVHVASIILEVGLN